MERRATNGLETYVAALISAVDYLVVGLLWMLAHLRLIANRKSDST
ncbi:hypothetical protein [Sphingomonas edaphi]|nr:hypothetical protein [Sphingomonas edaphi]